MSREIKFRVWDTIRERFVPTGDCCNGPFLSMRGTYVPVAAGEFIPVIVEQFTGLKDKDGRDIYEGDIVEIRWYDGWKDTTGFMVCYEVKWSFIAVGWRGFRPMMDNTCMGVDVNDSPAIIGNIHESLYLLK